MVGCLDVNLNVTFAVIMNKKITFSLFALLSYLPTTSSSEVKLTSNDGKYSAIFGGSLSGYYGVLNQEKLFTYTDAGNSQTRELDNTNLLTMSSNLSVNLESKIDEVTNYGIMLKLNANPSPTAGGKTYFADKTMLYIDSKKWGRIELGTYNGAHDRIQVTPANFAAGTGGPDGDYGLWLRQGAFFYANNTTPVTTPPTTAVPNYYDASSLFCTDLNLPGASSQKRANKITFYPVTINGFSAGVSFIPDQ